MDEALNRLMDQSWALDADIAEMFSDARPPAGTRGQVTLKMCAAARQHAAGQRILMKAGCTAPALALVRIHYESVVRALWMQAGASNDWIAKFAMPVPAEQLKESKMGPPVDSMLERLAVVAPPFVGASLTALKEASWRAMNSYVHGGVYAVAHALADWPADKQAAVLLNANGLGLLNAQALLLAYNDISLRGRLSKIQLAHRNCLPP